MVNRYKIADKVVEVTVSDENGNPNAKLHTCWTQKGRLMIYELLKEHGILPLIECNE